MKVLQVAIVFCFLTFPILQTQAQDSRDFCLVWPFQDSFGTSVYFVDCSEGVDRADARSRRLSVQKPLDNQGRQTLAQVYPDLKLYELSHQKILIDDAPENAVAVVFEPIRQTHLARLLGNRDYHSLRFSYTSREGNFSSVCRVHLKSFTSDSRETMMTNAELVPFSKSLSFPFAGSYSGRLAGVWSVQVELRGSTQGYAHGKRYDDLRALGYEVQEQCSNWVRN